MSLEQNKALVRRVHEQFESQGDLSLAEELFGPAVTSSHRPGRPAGPEGVRRHLAMLRGAFPDLSATIEQMVAEDDLVAVRLTMRGTHQGDFRGIAPTGRAVTWSGLVLRRIQDGKVVEQWSQFDTNRLIEQLQAPGESDAPA